MKKVLAILTALMMALMPVMSLGEQMGLSDLQKMNPALKYMKEGQEYTAEVTIEVTEMLLNLLGIPAEIQAGIQELLSTLAFRATAQTADGLAQVGLALMARGEEALGIRAAYGEQSLYVQSAALLGDEILQFTLAQLKEAAQQMLEGQISAGSVSQEQLDSVRNFLQLMRDDPQAAIRKLVGEPDLQGLQSALAAYPTIGVQPLTEKPESLPWASMEVRIPLQKEGLTAITTEIAKVIWNMPVVQKISTQAQLTEEKLVSGFNKIPNLLAEDSELIAYVGMEGSEYKIYVVGDAKLTNGTDAKDFHGDAMITVSAEGSVGMEYTLSSEGDTLMGNMNVTVEGGQSQFSYSIIGESTEDGVTYHPVEMSWTGKMNLAEIPQVQMEMIFRVRQTAADPQTGVVISSTVANEDKGDHAEGYADVVVSLEGRGELFAVHEKMSTGIAEAYIITPEATQPMTMSQEELNELVERVKSYVAVLPYTLIQYLPTSLLQVLMQQ